MTHQVVPNLLLTSCPPQNVSEIIHLFRSNERRGLGRRWPGEGEEDERDPDPVVLPRTDGATSAQGKESLIR